MAATRIVLATFNRDKVRELADLLAGFDVEVRGFFEFPGAVAAPEDGATLAENAFQKARAAFALTGTTSIADDTGLEVDALEGRPGIHAARYAGPDATYEDNRRRLIEEMRGRHPRTARFRTVCAACLAGGGEVAAEGVLEGAIVDAPRGANGFGYDPVFEVAGTGRTLAEMSDEEKNAISHRARAVNALVAKLGLR